MYTLVGLHSVHMPLNTALNKQWCCFDTRHGYEAWGYKAEANPKLWLDQEAEAKAEALTFWNHEAEAEAEALPYLNH